MGVVRNVQSVGGRWNTQRHGFRESSDQRTSKRSLTGPKVSVRGGRGDEEVGKKSGNESRGLPHATQPHTRTHIQSRNKRTYPHKQITSPASKCSDRTVATSCSSSSERVTKLISAPRSVLSSGCCGRNGNLISAAEVEEKER